MFVLTSPIWPVPYTHGVVTPSQPVCWTPAKWSPSSAVKVKSVLFLLMPSAASRPKKAANALS